MIPRLSSMPNPALTKQFGGEQAASDAALQTAAPPIVTEPGERMEIGGVLQATGILFILVLIGAYFGWQNAGVETLGPIFWVSMIVVIGVMIATIARPQWTRFTGPIFALVEGVLVGAVSKIYSGFYDGIVFQAVLATFAVFVSMLFLYATRIIKVTRRLRSTIILATVGIMFFYLISIVLSLFNVNIPLVWDGGSVSIVVSLLIVGVASFNLLLDFDLIERGINEGAPAWMNWYAAFGLMVTIIWLYLEMLRLLALIQGRD